MDVLTGEQGLPGGRCGHSSDACLVNTSVAFDLTVFYSILVVWLLSRV